MPLTLIVTEFKGAPSSRCNQKVFDSREGTVGRASDCDWVLDDLEEIISKRHCRIIPEGGVYRLIDISTNGVYVNGSSQRVPYNGEVILRHGDRLLIGDYLIEASIAMDEPAPERGPASGAVPSTSPAILGFGFGGSNQDKVIEPLAPLFSGGPGIDEPIYEGAPVAPQAAIPIDEDWLNSPAPDHAPIEQHWVRVPQPVAPKLGDATSLFPEGWNPLLDDGDDASAPDPPSPASRTNKRARDLGLRGDGRSLLPAGRDPLADNGPDNAPLVLGQRAVPTDRDPPLLPESVASSTPASVASEAALDAFLAGVGLSRTQIGAVSEAELLHAAGQRLRELAGGLRELMRVRAQIKSELRVDHTVMSRDGNNPLKFSVDGDAVLLALLLPSKPGFIASDKIVVDSFVDIHQHELALLAGARQAIATALEHFSPQTLATKLDKDGLLAKLLPATRKARYWDLFESQFQRVAEEAEESAHGPLARALARAYEEQKRHS